jgi:large subunit ribosomal protein L10
MLTRVEKEALVGDLKEKIEKANALFLTNFVGATANDSAAVRKNVRDAEGTVVVTKNTLFRLASQGTYAEELLKNLKGTNAIALAFGDAPAVAKAIDDASSTVAAVTLGSGYLGTKLLSTQEVIALAKLPSRDQMLATVLATFNAPVSAFVRVLDAIKRQKEEGGAAAPVEA